MSAWSSSNVNYLIHLQPDGRISIEQLRKAIDTLNTPETSPKSPAPPEPPTKTDEPPQSNVLENLHKRHRKKKKLPAKLVKQVQPAKPASLALNTIQSWNWLTSPCAIISKHMKLTHLLTKIPLCCSKTKKSLPIEQINADIEEYNGIKFSLGLSI